ncbi:DUF2809 domain-containing protein [Clostridium vincentii]|uniref:DUF2809 domain-containing protein n=1 Tax=Clostridium vincentii TaxID=52704 RepID=A0A2T0BCP5_9CLOT|nr:DUF2809 domain-containing protein [Clostridium vincentii]PRR81615.1 hypothetical protein CLVI_23400 [Clostridium vincentii]
MIFKYTRNRLLYAVLIIIVMILGLLSGKYGYIIPDFIDIYLGDALWASMIYLGVAFIFNKKRLKIVAAFGLSFCYLIEISQLYHANWIDNIRQTTLGGLILGYGFLWSDLVAYSMGIGIGVIIDLIISKSYKIVESNHR